ncbi:phasin family protein [Mycetohabitans sp. B5]|nr:phasin family protein [Mycetohabitans sp. B5]
MSLVATEQLADAQKSDINTLFGLAGKVFDGVEKATELNSQAWRYDAATDPTSHAAGVVRHRRVRMDCSYQRARQRPRPGGRQRT